MSAGHRRRALCGRSSNNDNFWEMRHRLIVNATISGAENTTLPTSLTSTSEPDSSGPANDQVQVSDRKDLPTPAWAGSGLRAFVIVRIVGDGVEGVKVVVRSSFGVFDAKPQGSAGYSVASLRSGGLAPRGFEFVGEHADFFTSMRSLMAETARPDGRSRRRAPGRTSGLRRDAR